MFLILKSTKINGINYNEEISCYKALGQERFLKKNWNVFLNVWKHTK